MIEVHKFRLFLFIKQGGEKLNLLQLSSKYQNLRKKRSKGNKSRNNTRETSRFKRTYLLYATISRSTPASRASALSSGSRNVSWIWMSRTRNSMLRCGVDLMEFGVLYLMAVGYWT